MEKDLYPITEKSRKRIRRIGEDKKLIIEAKKAMKSAYAPYSNFKVGAALLSKTGKVFSGANLENSSLGLTVCAERVALYKALSFGGKDFTKIAVVASGERPITPCGLCRQALFEFSPNIKVICSNLKGKVKKFTLKQLLPYPFRYEKRRK